ncbi:MAG: DUF3313 family protein [Syntrophaceae bacterium]|nr:DUF3313 family protein [Syntrophaceae bacterium]
MKSLLKKQIFQVGRGVVFTLALLLVSGSIAFMLHAGDLKKGDVTTDGLTVVESGRFTEKQIKHGVEWSAYTKYQITPVDVSFRKDWKRDYNREQRTLSARVTDKDMARIRETVAEIVYDEFNEVLQKKGGFTKVDEADENTLLFKPVVINLDVYAPDLQHSLAMTDTYVRQAGKATLILELHDAVSGEILARWVDTREDPDNGYFEWANRITNIARAKLVVRGWANRLVEGLDILKTVN